jgi:hypothetical protein
MNQLMFRGLRLAALVWSVIGLTFITAHAQVVSGGLSTTVRTPEGDPVPGASVTVVHVPTNATSTGTTRANGTVAFRGLPAGGPFTVTVTAVGYNNGTVNGVMTALGEDVNVPVTLTSGVITMDAFIAEADRTDLDPNSTGAGSLLDSDRLSGKPSAQRSLADLASASPLVTLRASIGDREESQITAVGQNNRYNSISIDGARINDQFGLNMTGLASFFNPLSVDTIEQMSVQISPYDTRQAGFTGAAINATTKSGTNKFAGTLYYIYGGDEVFGIQMQGEDVIDKEILGVKIVPQVERTTQGFTLGGPILKNRLFFFMNYEKFERVSPPSSPGLLSVTGSDMTAFISRLNQYSTAAGKSIPWGESLVGSTATNITSDEKQLAKLDWNISSNHRASVRYSTTEGDLPQYGKYQGFAFSPPNSGIITNGSTALSTHIFTQKRKEEVWAGQVFSQWTQDFRTELKYSQVTQDQETPLAVVAPEVTVFGLGGVNRNGQAITNASYVAGTEFSRQGNQINTDSKSYSASGDYNFANWVLSGGVEREENNFYNIFANGSYGSVTFRNLDDFLNDRPNYIDRAVYDPARRPDIADISDYTSNAAFVQGKWDVAPGFNVLAGVRYEVYESDSIPPFNQAFFTATGFRNTGTLDGADAISPRLAFNWQVDDERRMQVRGGIGHFSGRAPWVIFSNSFNNPGVGRFNVTQNAGATGTLAQGAFGAYLATFDPANPIGTATDVATAARQIDWVDDGITLPSVWRGNIALDYRLPNIGSTLSLEVVHTKNDEQLFITNENLLASTRGADGRQRFSGAPTGLATNSRFVNYRDLYRVSNVSVGSSTYFTISLDRPMRNNWSANFSFSHGDAKDAQSFGQTTASGQWQRNAVFNQSVVEENISDFEVKDRVQVSLARRFEFVKSAPTTVSLYYEGRTGDPYSWTYSSDLNGDGQVANDLVAVPTGVNDPRFNFTDMPQSMIDSYFAFLGSSGLSRYAGGYAPKNVFNGPFVSRLDLKFSQIIPIYTPSVIEGVIKPELELFLDFINFGSFLSEDLFGGYFLEPNQKHFGSEMFRRNRLGQAVYGTDGRIIPQKSVATATTFSAFSPDAFVYEEGQSRWRIQVGARLKF